MGGGFEGPEGSGVQIEVLQGGGFRSPEIHDDPAFDGDSVRILMMMNADSD
jgi:hypothetical protein